MLKRMKRVAAGLLVAVFLLNISAVSGTSDLAQVEAASLVTKGTVTSKILNIRVSKSTKAKKITTLKKGAKVTLLSNNSKWVAVKVNGRVGYTQGQYIRVANGGTASATAMSKGQQVVNYAKKFVGNKYRYGGTSLTNGTDCSGFTRGVYKKFGKNLPHSSSAQRNYGTKVKGGIKNAKPGDLICYSGHVAIYMGNNKIVHASNSAPYPKGGIKISNVNYRTPICARRIIR